jgi:hypothetical protein
MIETVRKRIWRPLDRRMGALLSWWNAAQTPELGFRFEIEKEVTLSARRPTVSARRVAYETSSTRG